LWKEGAVAAAGGSGAFQAHLMRIMSNATKQQKQQTSVQNHKWWGKSRNSKGFWVSAPQQGFCLYEKGNTTHNIFQQAQPVELKRFPLSNYNFRSIRDY